MKLFSNTRVTKKQLRQLMGFVAVEHKVKNISFNNQTKKVGGLYDPKKKSIFINNKQTKKAMLFVFFHELAHHVAVQQKKWLHYHNGLIENISPDEQFAIENQIDKIAKKLWSKYVVAKMWGKYKFIYPKADKIALTAWLADYYSKH
jgi:Zn-dependent peptidase ImmA (M78 family)